MTYVAGQNSSSEADRNGQEASVPQTIPNLGKSDDAPFIWQKLSEMSEKLGSINTNLSNLSGQINSVDSRTYRIEEKTAKLEGTVDRQLDRVKTAWIVAAFILGVIAVVLIAAWPVVIKPGLKTMVTEEMKPLIEQQVKESLQKSMPPSSPSKGK